MKQSEMKKNVEGFYLEGLSKSIKREKTLKSGHQIRYEEGAMNELVENATNMLKTGVQGLTNFINQLKGNPALINNYKTALNTAIQGGQIARNTVEEIVAKVINNFNKIDQVSSQLGQQLTAILTGQGGQSPTKSLDSFAVESAEDKWHKGLKKYFAEADGDNVTPNVQMGLSPDSALEADAAEGTDVGDEDGQNKDAMDEAQEILEQIDLASISNGVRIELIEAIIDSAQNAVDGDEANDSEFSDFMQQVSDIVEGFRYDGEEEEGIGGTSAEGGMEPGDEGGEEVNGNSMANGLQEEGVRGKKSVELYNEDVTVLQIAGGTVLGILGLWGALQLGGAVKLAAKLALDKLDDKIYDLKRWSDRKKADADVAKMKAALAKTNVSEKLKELNDIAATIKKTLDAKKNVELKKELKETSLQIKRHIHKTIEGLDIDSQMKRMILSQLGQGIGATKIND